MSEQRESTANPSRGEVSVHVTSRATGQTKEYKLKLSMNAAATLEQQTKKTFSKLLAEAEALSFIAIRQIVWLLLQPYHSSEFKSVESVGSWIDDAGGVSVFFESMAGLIGLNKPTDDAKKDGDSPLGESSSATGESST